MTINVRCLLRKVNYIQFTNIYIGVSISCALNLINTVCFLSSTDSVCHISYVCPADLQQNEFGKW